MRDPSLDPISDTAPLPTSQTLRRTTLMALAVAGVVMTGVVLPAEYGIDPTGIGRVLGLTKMGKLKHVLLQEEADLQQSTAPPARDSLSVTLQPRQHIELRLDDGTRGVAADLIAPFDSNGTWTWDNRMGHDVQVTVRRSQTPKGK